MSGSDALQAKLQLVLIKSPINMFMCRLLCPCLVSAVRSSAYASLWMQQLFLEKGAVSSCFASENVSRRKKSLLFADGGVFCPVPAPCARRLLNAPAEASSLHSELPLQIMQFASVQFLSVPACNRICACTPTYTYIITVPAHTHGHAHTQMYAHISHICMQWYTHANLRKNIHVFPSSCPPI